MWKLLVSSLAVATLSGCATMTELSSEVTSYSQWPAQRKPASYVFERLPSQNAHLEQQQALENAARRSLDAAGFTLAADAASADVRVQLGARVGANEPSPFADPFWWRGGLFYGRYGRPFWGPGWATRFETVTYEREVALLIRDRQTGQPLYEARATSDGVSPALGGLLPAMFAAALKDFPNGGEKPHTVTTPIAP